ncbi:MAG: hypothetical protein HY329_15205, partial [Chloroflexi bacterium]|nr:hypothetical protein [Chloroflexota bacterium]
VAGMLRSFNYAVYAGLRERGARDGGVASAGDGGVAGAGEPGGAAPQLSDATLERWGRVWEQLVREAYLEGYFGAMPRSLAGASRADVDRLIEVFELDKAVYELGYELNNRPDWLPIPLTRVAEIGGEG